MQTVLPIAAIALGTVTAAVAVLEMVQYRKLRQAYVNAGILPGTKTEGK